MNDRIVTDTDNHSVNGYDNIYYNIIDKQYSETSDFYNIQNQVNPKKYNSNNIIGENNGKEYSETSDF